MYGKEWNVAFIDLRKAFDSVDRVVLFKWLMEDVEKRGIPFEKRCIEILQELFCVNYVKFGNSTWEIDTGTQQGAKTSPALFNYFLHKLT